jgi:hypothetical protein
MLLSLRCADSAFEPASKVICAACREVGDMG